MENWQKFILGAAGILIALGVIWTKLLKPTLDFYANAKQLVPLLKEITKVFGTHPEALSELKMIAAQFTTDGGSSLKDQINRLEATAERQELAAQKAEANAEHLKIGVASQKSLAEDDREQLRKLFIEFGVNARRMDALALGMEDIQKDARSVADDLAAAHKRADEVSNQPHGAAADAAAQQTAKERRENRVQKKNK